MPTYLLDENVNRPDYIIERCRNLDIEVLRVHQLELDQTEDGIIFQTAIEQGYIVVTGNMQDFHPLQTEWLNKGHEFPGVSYLSANAYRNADQIAEKIIEVEQNYQPNGEWWVSL